MMIRRIFAALPLFICLSAFAGEAEDIQKLLKNRQLPQALAQADQFLATNPKDAQVRFLKGIIQTELGQANDAIKTFTALAADYPQLPEPYNNLAVLYAQQGQLDKSRSALLMAIQTNPAYAIAHENLGDLYARLASQSYDKALQLESSNPNVQTKLTMVRELFSKTPQAFNNQAEPSKKPVVIAAVATATSKPISTVTTTVATATPKATIAPTTAPTVTPTPIATVAKANADEGKIISAVNAWASAWSSKDVNGYLAAYERDYSSSKNQKHSDWAKERRERVSAPKSISVMLANIRVEMKDDNTAIVRFNQSYRSNILTSTTSKELELKKTGSRWLISAERTGR